ncbi:hypothetical protein [Treponema endosymbiont of Eucomonympha sp.]|uniref:hypothetical protein n=1 Tax=Treponema endosymbiont of Eucomonympha sp. TaxID=1580831 RepID=UPI00075097C5|nr:hypothetical protein [Treponema endosymbiont of Eucomonympha sp.]
MDLFAETDTALDVARAEFIEGLRLSWQELFEGFDTLQAITYSSDIDFMTKLVAGLKKLKSASVFPKYCPIPCKKSSPIKTRLLNA